MAKHLRHILQGDHRAALGEGLDDAVKFEFLKRRTHMGAEPIRRFWATLICLRLSIPCSF